MKSTYTLIGVSRAPPLLELNWHQRIMLRTHLRPMSTRREQVLLHTTCSSKNILVSPRSTYSVLALIFSNFKIEYRLTWNLDSLRRSDYRRLGRLGETYVDYMGGSIYPESLIRVHADFLSDHIMGNTHSVSNR